MTVRSLPDQEELTLGLAAMLAMNREDLTIVDRQPNIYTSTFPEEIVRCRAGARGELRLLCKYGRDYSYEVYNHKRGVRYEAAVYRDVLRPAGAEVPRFYGTHVGEDGSVWLVLDFLEGSIRLHTAPQPEGMALAARWIGRFHARPPASVAGSFLSAYDAPYYQGWARRTLEFSGELRARYPWLAPACEGFGRLAEWLAEGPATVIHGEYYPDNILCRGGAVYPIDWESAAVGAAEIDLATLTDRWPESTARMCEREYARTRWPQGLPDGHSQRLLAARLYAHLRWLGERPEQTLDPRCGWRYEAMRPLAEQLRLV